MWENNDIKEILITREQIEKRSVELGRQITEDYRALGRTPLLVALLRGSVPFLSELMKNIDLDIQYDFMDVKSYVGTQSQGDIKILKDLDDSIKGKDILIIEDIVDTGNTLNTVCKTMYLKGATSVKIATLLDKPSRRTNNVKADYIGFEVPNVFVVGYGMDFDQRYRCLPYIGVLKEECYK